MSKHDVELPPKLEERAEREIQSGRYVDIGDYVRDLIRRDAESEERLIFELEKGLASGSSPRGFEEMWQVGRERGRSRAA